MDGCPCVLRYRTPHGAKNDVFLVISWLPYTPGSAVIRLPVLSPCLPSSILIRAFQCLAAAARWRHSRPFPRVWLLASSSSSRAGVSASGRVLVSLREQTAPGGACCGSHKTPAGCSFLFTRSSLLQELNLNEEQGLQL